MNDLSRRQALEHRDQPIAVRRGELVRFDVVVAGPNHGSTFHVVGGMFDHVELDGNPGPGGYMFMTHRFADATRGAMGMLMVT